MRVKIQSKVFVSPVQGSAGLVKTTLAAASEPQALNEDQEKLFQNLNWSQWRLTATYVIFSEYINGSFYFHPGKTTVETPLMVTETSGVDLVTLHWDLYQTQHEILKLPVQRGL